jgi:hypothetical protein
MSDSESVVIDEELTRPLIRLVVGEHDFEKRLEQVCELGHAQIVQIVGDCEGLKRPSFEFPPHLGGLALALRELTIRRTCLMTLPDDLSPWRRLTMLDLSDNDITHVPDSLTSMSSLRELRLDGNGLSSPPELRLGGMKKLRVLSLSRNKFEKCPYEVRFLEALEELWLDSNMLSELPVEASKLTKLRLLSLAHNPLSAADAQLAAVCVGVWVCTCQVTLMMFAGVSSAVFRPSEDHSANPVASI